MINQLIKYFASIFRCFDLQVNSESDINTSEEFIITNLSANPDGDTYFEDININTNDIKPLGLYSEGAKVKELYFRKSLSLKTYDFHPAPESQYIIYLSGEAEIETSKGVKKLFKAGDILLATDTLGKGHKTTITKNGKAIIVTVGIVNNDVS